MYPKRLNCGLLILQKSEALYINSLVQYGLANKPSNFSWTSSYYALICTVTENFNT